MYQFIYAAFLSICSISGIVGCETVATKDPQLQIVSHPLNGEFVGANYMSRSSFKAPKWNINLDPSSLPVEPYNVRTEYKKIFDDLRMALFSLEVAYPDLSMNNLAQLANICKQYEAQKKEAEATKIKNEFNKRISKDLANKTLDLQRKIVWAAFNFDPLYDVDDLITRQYLLMYMTGVLHTPENTPAMNELNYQQMMTSQAKNDLQHSNDYLSAVEDLTQKKEQTPLLILMYRGINNFFLGNYDAAATSFITADEYKDQENDYYVYNKLQLYNVIAHVNWPEGRAFLKRFEDFITNDPTPAKEKVRDSWAFKIIHALNTEDFNSIVEEAKKIEDAKTRAENLTELYYYVALELYHRDQKDLAKLFFALSRAQNITNFMEYNMADLALSNLFKKETNGSDKKSAQ